MISIKIYIVLNIIKIKIKKKFKVGEKCWADIFPKKIYKCPTRKLKDVQQKIFGTGKDTNVANTVRSYMR